VNAAAVALELADVPVPAAAPAGASLTA